MKTATVRLKSVSPYGQGKYHDTEKLEKESPANYEKRTWREKLHVNKDGYVFIPPMAFKNCLSECAKYLSIKIPGKGQATYTKHFEAGISISEPVVLDIKKEDVPAECLFVPSDGRRGGTKRVSKYFPVIHDWKGTLIIHIFDETITEDVLKKHLEQAGQFIGVGRFRPRNNGYYGRFNVKSIFWK